MSNNNDFFTNVHFSTSQGKDHQADQESVISFAQAIALRFGSADLLTARILPVQQQSSSSSSSSSSNPSLTQTPTLSSPKKLISSPTFISLTPSDLTPYLLNHTSLLILDIRPHAAHTAARLHNALSLSIPSTLLKRPLFGLSKLVQMLPSTSARARFAAWPTTDHILVYDADSLLIPDTGNIAGLLRKFRAEGFTGELAWIKGGFQAVWREARHCATTDHPSPDEDDTESAASSGALRTKHLPKAAFSLSSTTAAAASGTSAFTNAANPFYDTIRQNVELSHGITERIPLRLPKRLRRRIHDLPFHWLQDIARRSALRPSPPSSSSSSSFPSVTSIGSSSESSDDPHESDPDSNDPDVEEGAETLAMQFYRIELAEQRRLRTVMEHHARESEIDAAAGQPYTLGEADQGIIGVSAYGVAKSVPSTPVQGAFPFSITAGVEKGAKNRYNHIWPFEHARVRLHDGRHQGSHPGPKDKKKVAFDGAAGEITGEASITFPSASLSTSDSQLAPIQEDRARDTLTNVDGIPIRTLSGPAPPSTVQMTPLRFARSDGSGGDVYFPHIPTIPQRPQISQTTENGSTSLSPPRPGAQHRTGDFGSSSLKHDFLPPSATSKVTLTTFPPQFGIGSQGGGFKLTLPGANKARGPASAIGQVSAMGPGHSQFNFEVVPPLNKDDKPRNPSPADDYVNASYVQPLGTRKRYIATQGPLPATFVDFWTLVWEQNVHVIVMLTREIENAMVKCGTYWTDISYGPLQLQLLNTFPPISPTSSLPNNSTDAGFFSAPRERDKGSKQQPSMIVRTFALSHRGYPGVPPRRVTHLQYLEWPDMNVPEDPRGVLELVKRVELAVQESTPGPSPGSNSNFGSISGSLSSLSPSCGSPGKSTGLLSRGQDFFTSPPLGDSSAWRKSYRKGWRHPELDSKTGVATFALGCAPPVLLHCSAGVGRTGGFIAVDAVLDAIRRELRQRRELRARARARLAFGPTGMVSKSPLVDSGSGTESGGMDVDVDEGKERVMGTMTLVIGDRPKSHRHYVLKEGATSPSESLVLHVPLAGLPSASAQTKDMTSADEDTRWQSLSTREWAEQVLDQTHPCEGELPLALPLSMSLCALPAPSDRSPGSTPSSSGPSAFSSVDVESVGSGNGVGGKIESGLSGSGSAKSGSIGAPPPSSVSTSNSGSRSASGPCSISISNSGSGTNSSSNSGFWGSSGTESSGFMGLMRARLRDSSVTSLSNMDSDFSNDKLRVSSLRQPLAVHVSKDEDAMDVDRPPRPVSVPLHSGKNVATWSSSEFSASPAKHSNLRARQMIGSSSTASFSTPALPTMNKASGNSTGMVHPDDEPILCANPSPDESMSPPKSFESWGCVDVEISSGQSRQVSPDESHENLAALRKAQSRSKVIEMTCAIGTTPGQETTTKFSSVAKHIEPTKVNKAKLGGLQGGAVPSITLPVPELTEQKTSAADLMPSELDQRAAGHAVIDYKLPRQLHQDLSPAPLMSHTNPIWTVVQDMREQRMSLCQSLRQYVFVHAAVIEGALMIVDEERELWGDSTGSEGSPEPEGASNISEGGRKSDATDAHNVPFGIMGSMDISGMGHSQGSRDRTRSLPPVGGRSSASSSSGSQMPAHATTSTSSVVSSSPSKWKRGPSPTELLKEDKSGAVSLAKRPSFKRRTSSDEPVLIAGLRAGTPQASSRSNGNMIDRTNC